LQLPFSPQPRDSASVCEPGASVQGRTCGGAAAASDLLAAGCVVTEGDLARRLGVAPGAAW